MQIQISPQHLIRSGIALAVALTLGSLFAAPAAESEAGEKMSESKGMQRCQEMKEMKAKMRADMKVHDAQFTEELATMNRASQDKKTDLMAAVVTHMVEHRIAMDALNAKMEDKMMQHMMQHMEMGKESMGKCPMMKDKHDKKTGADVKHHDKTK